MNFISQLITVSIFIITIQNVSLAQIGIGTDSPDPTAILHIESIDKGLLIPSLKTSQRIAITGPADGLLVHDLNLKSIFMYDSNTASWKNLITTKSIVDADGDTKVSVEETSDEDLIRFTIKGKNYITIDTSRIIIDDNTDIYIGNVAGQNSGFHLNTIVGNESFDDNTTGSKNTSIGWGSLQDNTTGDDNFSGGVFALQFNRTGSDNVAIGSFAMRFSDEGNRNIALGSHSQYQNAFGDDNISMGDSSLLNNNSGSHNIAVGKLSLSENMSSDNISIGISSSTMNTNGSNNVVLGNYAFSGHEQGSYNIAIGNNALKLGSEGNSNVALGHASLYNSESHNNTAIGDSAHYNNVNGENNTYLGAKSHSNNSEYSNSTALGFDTEITASNQVRVGNTEITSIGGQVSWSTLSDKRTKSNILENIVGLDFIMGLRPVSYQYNNDKINKRYSGLIAQEVADVASQNSFDFSGVDMPKNEDDMYNLKYAEFVIPLIKALQEQQILIQSLEKRIELLEH